MDDVPVVGVLKGLGNLLDIGDHCRQWHLCAGGVELAEAPPRRVVQQEVGQVAFEAKV